MPMNIAEMNHFQDIYDALDHGQTDEAMRLICQEQQKTEHSAELYYLQGKVFMKQSDWGNAISCFLKSEEIEPEGPARQCRLMLTEIMTCTTNNTYTLAPEVGQEFDTYKYEQNERSSCHRHQKMQGMRTMHCSMSHPYARIVKKRSQP